MSNVQIAVIYHSTYGHTARQAQAVRTGVERVEGAHALLLTTEQAQGRWDDLAPVSYTHLTLPTNREV